MHQRETRDEEVFEHSINSTFLASDASNRQGRIAIQQPRTSQKAERIPGQP